MKKGMALVLCALFASAGTAVADDAAKDSMAMHKKMIDDCAAKRGPATGEQAAMKACKEMLEKSKPSSGTKREGLGKEMHDRQKF
jgi:hypothetical protein